MTQGSTQYLRFRVAMLFIRLSTHTVADPETGKWGGAGTDAVTGKKTPQLPVQYCGFVSLGLGGWL